MVETLRLDQISIMQKVLSKGHNTVVVLKNIFLRIWKVLVFVITAILREATILSSEIKEVTGLQII